MNQYHPLFNNAEARGIEEWICEIGRQVYTKGFAAANDGNISYRIGPNEVLCSPTMICKGFMTPDGICMVDLDGNQLAGKRKRTSEILLHLTIMKEREDVRSVVHCHPPHATAFAVSREAIPQCILPEIEVFMGEVPLAPYETPGGQGFADTVRPFLKATNTIILTNHGTVSFGKTLEEAYWKTEILDAYCRILILSKQLGGVTYLNEQKSREPLDLKKKLGFDDPRFHLENCDLCSNTAFREGYKSVGAQEPKVAAFDAPPKFPGYLKQPSSGAASGGVPANINMEALIQAITDQVVAALR